MSDISTIGVAGTDGLAPVYNPDGRWQLWSINDVWMGIGPGKNRYVPKVGDYVIDPETSATYIVDFIDPVTLIPTLREKRLISMSYNLSEADVLFGVGPGNQSDTHRVYLDTSVLPHVLAVDARLKVPGTDSHHVKIFRGTAQGNEVISKIYDNSGNFVSENVPLEVVAIDSHVNYSIKKPVVCYCTTPMPDAEIVTLVAYSSSGHVTYKRQLLVENTSFIRDVNASTRYISHISLKTPFLSPTETHVVTFPLNVPTNALNLVGVVHYSDGSTLELPVDGTKFRMLGIDQYLSSIPGQKIPAVLSYALGPDEVAYRAVNAGQKYITEAYDLETINPNNSYSVKLYGYPEWISDVAGYRMRWFLFNLDRSISFDVTDKVRVAGDQPIDSFADNYTQKFTVYLNLRDVSTIFKPFVHTQVVEIVLRNDPLGQTTPWTVTQESSVGHIAYGLRTTAKKLGSNNKALSLAAGCSTVEEWLAKTYDLTYPLIDKTAEARPLVPTHFEIQYGTHKLECPIDDWKTAMVFPVETRPGHNVYVKFIRRTTMADLELSKIAMFVQA